MLSEKVVPCRPVFRAVSVRDKEEILKREVSPNIPAVRNIERASRAPCCTSCQILSVHSMVQNPLVLGQCPAQSKVNSQ